MAHKAKLESFLHLNNINIVFISEIYLFSDTNLSKFHNYATFTPNYPSGHPWRGAAVTIKCAIQHYNYGVFFINSIQTSIISIVINNREVCIGGIYCPPQEKPKGVEFQSLFSHLRNYWILEADFNAEHPS